MNINGLLHIIGGILLCMYPFIIQKNKYDYLYIYFLFFLNISWIVCKGECFFSYLFNHNKNKNYKFGENPELHDIKDILKNNYIYYSFIIHLLINVTYFMVVYRNNYPSYLYIFIIFQIILNLLIYKFKKKLNENKIFINFGYVFLFLIIIFIILFSNYLHKNKKF